jgi:hypothetical protein
LRREYSAGRTPDFGAGTIPLIVLHSASERSDG